MRWLILYCKNSNLVFRKIKQHHQNILFFKVGTLMKQALLYREEKLSNLFCLISEKGSALKGQNLLPIGANSFLLEQTLFQKVFRVH